MSVHRPACSPGGARPGPLAVAHGDALAQPFHPQRQVLPAADGDLHAPHLIDTEVLHALRRLLRRGRISTERAHDARTDLADLTIVRYPHEPLNDRVWELRENLSAYDATFVALAEALDVPLVTCDAHLAAAPSHHAHIELHDNRRGSGGAGA